MLTFRENVVPNISQQVIQMLKAKMFHSFEELLTFFMKDRLIFIRDNRKAFKVFVKELYYREDFRAECLPQLDNEDLKRYANEILNHAKAKGEISDLPNSIIFRTFGILSISYFVGRFTILPDNLFLEDDYEIDLLVKQIMSALRV